MKNLILALSAFLLMAFMISCGGSPKVETSAEMTDFIGMLKGSNADVTAALNKYAATDELKKDDMAMYDLKEPVVTQADGTCYTFEAKAGLTTCTYKVCWTDKQISSIESLGMK
jgi:hypothetical protein